jgi:hypothetical protein
MAVRAIEREHRFSLLDALPYPWMVTAFLLAWVGVLIALGLGYCTRQMALLNFMMILSLHERNPYVLDGADNVARVMSFWAIFLPLGAAYSVDRWRQVPQRMGVAFPLRMAQLQIVLIYTFAGLLKLSGGVWLAGEGLFYALQLRSLTLPTGDWMLAHLPFEVLQGLSYAVLIFELSFGLLIWHPFLRKVALLGGVLFHLGIALTMTIPNFSWVMILSYSLFLPEGWLEKLEGRLKASWPVFMASIVPSAQGQITRWWRLAQAGQTVFLGGVMLTILAWNLNSIERQGQALIPPVEGGPRLVIQYLSLGQQWAMFAPYPTTFDGWIIIPGEFEDGRSLDLFTMQPVNYQMPRPWAGYGLRWRKYQEALYRYEYPDLLLAWGRYLCRTINEEAGRPVGGRLARFEIVYWRRFSVERGQAPMPYTPYRLWQHWCYDDYAPSD